MKKVMFYSVLLLLVASCSMEKLYQMKQNRKVYPFEQVDFQELMQRYMNKEASSGKTIEGIYSVSVVVTKKGKGMLDSSERERIVVRKENYSKVAILRDHSSTGREFLEISLDKDRLPSYSVRGEYTGMSEANILVYSHFEPRGQILTYTFTYDQSKDILEGVRTEMSGQSEITYKLTYLKLNPDRGLVTHK
ncbi:MAG: hypothetical protein JNM78_18045 [Cyclobacteriaceae bacterium]|nr:hypothetical protein [Cyclobacteriaceae bacterium]